MAMTMKVAMHERHMVRKYLDKPIPADIVETLNDRIRKLNNDHGIEMKLITEDKSAFSTVVRLILAKGVRNYIILAGKEADDCQCGYYALCTDTWLKYMVGRWHIQSWYSIAGFT